MKKPTRPRPEILADLWDVLDTLEGPENIDGDGEYPRAQVAATYRALEARKAKCYRDLGGEIGDMEVWAWSETPEGIEAIRTFRAAQE